MALAVLVEETPPPPHGVLAASQARAIADMRGFLSLMNPQSTAESLRLLRTAYPQSSLGMRIAACGLSAV